MSAASGPPVPSWSRTPQDDRPRAAWPDEENQALANSRLLDLWVVAPDPGARVGAAGPRKGSFPCLGVRGLCSRGSGHSAPLVVGYRYFCTPPRPLNPAPSIRVPGAASRLGFCWEKGLGLPFRTSFPDFLSPSHFTFLSKA